MVKVQLPKVEEETRTRVNLFKESQKLYNPDNKIKTFEDAVLFAIDEAGKVPALEARIKELEETTLSKDEASAVYSAVGDVDLWNTEDDEYTALIRSAGDKLWKMKKEVK